MNFYNGIHIDKPIEDGSEISFELREDITDSEIMKIGISIGILLKRKNISTLFNNYL